MATKEPFTSLIIPLLFMWTIGLIMVCIFTYILDLIVQQFPHGTPSGYESAVSVDYSAMNGSIKE